MRAYAHTNSKPITQHHPQKLLSPQKYPHLTNPTTQKILAALKQKHKKQPFSDASASHLSLVLWPV